MRPSQTQLVVEMKESRPLSESLCIYRAKKEPEEIAYCAEKWRQTKWNRDKLFSSCHWCPLKKANVFDNFQVSHYIFHTDIVIPSELGHSCAVYQLQGHRASPCSCHQLNINIQLHQHKQHFLREGNSNSCRLCQTILPSPVFSFCNPISSKMEALSALNYTSQSNVQKVTFPKPTPDVNIFSTSHKTKPQIFWLSFP